MKDQSTSLKNAPSLCQSNLREDRIKLQSDASGQIVQLGDFGRRPAFLAAASLQLLE